MQVLLTGRRREEELKEMGRLQQRTNQTRHSTSFATRFGSGETVAIAHVHLERCESNVNKSSPVTLSSTACTAKTDQSSGEVLASQEGILLLIPGIYTLHAHRNYPCKVCSLLGSESLLSISKLQVLQWQSFFISHCCI